MTEPVGREAMERARERRDSDLVVTRKIQSVGFEVEITRAGVWRLTLPELTGPAKERMAAYCNGPLQALRYVTRFIILERNQGRPRGAWTARWTGVEAARTAAAAVHWEGAALPVNPGGLISECVLHRLGKAVESRQAVQAAITALGRLNPPRKVKAAELRAVFGLMIVGPVFKTEVEAAQAWAHEDLAQTVRVIRGWRVEFPSWVVTATDSSQPVQRGGGSRPIGPRPPRSPSPSRCS